MLYEREDAVEIHSDGAMPLFIGHAIDGCVLRRPDAVIGDQNVETPECRDRGRDQLPRRLRGRKIDRKSTRLNSSHLGISYAVFCLTYGDAGDLHSFPTRRSSDL